jgi:hypothetical protein
VPICLRRRNAGRRQHHSRCEDGGDRASHYMCGINASGIVEISKGSFSCAEQSRACSACSANAHEYRG